MLFRSARDAWLAGDDERCRAALKELAALDAGLGAACRAAAAAYADDATRARHWLGATPSDHPAAAAIALVARSTLAERCGDPEPDGGIPADVDPSLLRPV